MTLTADQLIARRKFIGGSDSPAICGVDPYRTAGDVWASKVYDLDDSDPGEPAELGNLLEPILVQLAAKALGVHIETGIPTLCTEDGILGVNLDAQISPEQIVEAKTTGITEGWGEPDEPNNVPEKVLVQCAHAMHVTGALVTWVPVILGRFGLTFRLYRVDRNDELCDLVAERGRSFYRRYVETRTAPPDEAPSLEILKRIRRRPKSVAVVADELVERYQRASRAAKGAKVEAEEAQAALIAAMGDAEALTSGAGNYTYYEQHNKEHVRKAATFRVLRESKVNG